MTTSSTSYLQTLAKAEAIAFVASLQNVKTHLSHELAWMSQQVQLKTVQLQGLEPLLTEAAALGLMRETVNVTVEPTVTTEPATSESSTAAAIASGIAINGNDLAALPVMAAPARLDSASNGNAAPAKPTPSTASGVTPPPVRGKRGAQPAATQKKSTAPALQAKPRASGNVSQPAKVSTQPFVRSQFQDQSITDAVGEILKRSRSPLDADAIMTALYEGLSDAAYKRAKNSVTNILSVGRGKGKWQSTGRGLYANNALANS